MVKKKTVKATPKKVAPKKAAKKVAKFGSAKAVKTLTGLTKKFEVVDASATSVKDLVLEALNKLLEVAEAQMYDAFRQYINAKFAQGLPASLEEFIAVFTKTFAAHGMTEEKLYNSLEESDKDYLMASAKQAENGKASAKKEKAAVVTEQKAVTKIQSDQASKIDQDEFSVGNGSKTVVTEAATGKSSVFSDLDVL